MTATAEAAASSAAAAVATVEAGFPLAYAGSLTGLGSSTEYTTMYAETVGAYPRLADIFRTTGEAARYCELVGIAPFSSITIRADKAALALASEAGSNGLLGGATGGDESGGVACFGKSYTVRANATAVALGAASLPPLDRAGLSEALRLHIITAPAKSGGWRGGIWGGTRPLDDPCIAFAFHETTCALVEKLKNGKHFLLDSSGSLNVINCVCGKNTPLHKS